MAKRLSKVSANQVWQFIQKLFTTIEWDLFQICKFCSMYKNHLCNLSHQEDNEENLNDHINRWKIHILWYPIHIHDRNTQ